MVERTLAWPGQARPPANDHERLPEGVDMIHAAISRIMLRRLARATR